MIVTLSDVTFSASARVHNGTETSIPLNLFGAGGEGRRRDRFWQVTSLQQLADAGIILRVVSAAVNNSVNDHKAICLAEV
jgi:hypothetical protein